MLVVQHASMDTAGPDKNRVKLHGVNEGSWAVPTKIKYVVLGSRSSVTTVNEPPVSPQVATTS